MNRPTTLSLFQEPEDRDRNEQKRRVFSAIADYQRRRTNRKTRFVNNPRIRKG